MSIVLSAAVALLLQTQILDICNSPSAFRIDGACFEITASQFEGRMDSRGADYRDNETIVDTWLSQDARLTVYKRVIDGKVATDSWIMYSWGGVTALESSNTTKREQ